MNHADFVSIRVIQARCLDRDSWLCTGSLAVPPPIPPFPPGSSDGQLLVGHAEHRSDPGECRGRRHPLGRPQIGPHNPAQLHRGIGSNVNLVGELVRGRLVELVDTASGDIELPAMIDATQTALLVASEPQGGAAVRAIFIQQPDATLEELCARVEAATGVRSHPSMMCRELQRLGLPRKKKSSTTINATRRA